MPWLPVSLVFAIAALTKAVRGGLDEYLRSTAMFAPVAIPLVSRLMVSAEATTAILLLWPRTRRAGWLAAACLSSAFLVFHAAAILGDVGPCRCLGLTIAHNDFWNHALMGAVCAGVLAIGAASFWSRRMSGFCVGGSP